MRRLPIILMGLFLAGIVACNSSHNKANLINSIQEVETEDLSLVLSLTFWTSDTIKETNLELVLLMDTLYQQVRSGSFKEEPLDSQLIWIAEFRNQLEEYYDINSLGNNSLSIFDKADSVIMMAEKLWELDQDGSSMGQINNNLISSDRKLFIEYNEFQRLSDLYSSYEQKQALKKEFIAWHNLQELFYNIYSKLVGLHYYWGSAVGVINSYKLIELQIAHINLYKNDRMVLTVNSIIPDTLIKNSKNNPLIIEQLQRQWEFEKQSVKDNPDFYNQESYVLLDSIKKNIDRFPTVLDDWILKRNVFISQIKDELTYKQLINNTDKVLNSLSKMISTEN